MSDRVARAGSAAGEGAPGDYYVLDLGSGRYFALGEVGGFIWQRLDGSLDLRAVAAEVCREFEVSSEEAESDLIDFVHSLAGLDLVETVAAG